MDVELKATGKGILKQVLAVMALSSSITIMGTMLGWPSPVLLKMRETGKPFTMGTNEKSWMVSLVYLGNLISPLPLGYLMDAVGRKGALLMTVVIPILSWILILFAESAIQLYIARFLSGIWSGAVCTICPMYLCEISEPKLRGILSTFVQFDVNFGVLYVYILGAYVDYDMLAALCAIFPLLFVIFFWNMPESPYWLSMHDYDIEAAKTLSWLRGQPVNTDRVIEEIYELSLGVHEEMQHPRNFKDLVATKGHRKALLIVECLAMAQRLSGISAMMAFLSVTLPKKDVGRLKVENCVIVIAILWTAVVICTSYLVDFWGRKPLLLISSIGCCMGTTLIAVWYFLHEFTSVDAMQQHWIPFAGFVVYSVSFSVGLGPLPTTSQGEMFSANNRALASAITSMVLAFTSFISNTIYLPLADHFGMCTNYFLFSAISFATIFFVHFVVIETKGKTLHQVQEELEA